MKKIILSVLSLVFLFGVGSLVYFGTDMMDHKRFLENVVVDCQKKSNLNQETCEYVVSNYYKDRYYDLKNQRYPDNSVYKK